MITSQLEEVNENSLEGNLDSEKEVETNLSRFFSSASNGTNSRVAGSGIITIVNSKKNGKRITFSKELMEELEEPKAVQISFHDHEIAVGEDLPNNDHYFHPKKYGVKGVVYSADLVQEITNRFGLDFSDRVSITLVDVQYVTNNQKKVAIIKVK